MKVYVCGDIHSNINISKLSTSEWPEQKELNEDDLLIILGDFGLFWANEQTKEEKYWLDWLCKKKCTIVFIDGNHENHPVINSFPVENRWGGNVHVCHKYNDRHIYHLMRGEVFTFDNRTAFVMGGATSIDKKYRTEYISWWSEETPNVSQWTHAENNLNLYHNEVDFILTHTCPTAIKHKFDIYVNGVDDYKCNTSDLFDSVLNTVKFRAWHFGHIHQDRSYDNFYCHYNNKPLRII